MGLSTEGRGPQAHAIAGRPVRVLHLIETLGPGGAERLLHTNLKHLDPSRFESTVVTVFEGPDHWVGPIRRLGITVESLRCTRLGDIRTGVARLRRLLRARRFDVIHTHLWAANVIGRIAGRMAGVPVVSSVHCPDHAPEVWHDGSGVSIWKRRASLLLDRWSARFGCARMVAVSEYVREYAARYLHFPVGRIDLIYNPIDTDALSESAREGRWREELLNELGLEPDSRVLLNVGRVSPAKGILYAVRALPLILGEHPTTHLVLVGETTDARWVEHLKAEARARGVAERVHFIGQRRDVVRYLRGCDLFVFPSLYEGLGIALVEAMAAGRPCVATRTGPIPEVVTDGVDGWLVPPADAEALAAAVCELLADPARREALGRAAEASSLARFRPQAAADALARVYESVVARVRGTAAGD
ncbi:MAG TPA: glycosyltransferase family 4 protein [Pyrinomonadaceae bacterium]|nr:glycosyltransferase family 4 protein [Pyrinomonadaceae bacterium]